ncbi:MAG: glycosyltransferase [Terracidiphilus sp.]|jgi:glycosyltransferase involved in cell wall biosynthesis
MNWTIWLNIVSPHLSGLLRSLALIPDQSVTVVAEHEMPEVRKEIGWNTPDCSPARVSVGPHDEEIEQLIQRGAGQESVHVIGGGMKPGSLNRRVLPRLARTRATVGLMSEGANNLGIQGIARRVMYSMDRFFIEDKLDFIIAMGQSGVRWYKSAGYDASHVFPFMYVTERPAVESESRKEWEVAGEFRILYLGNFIPRKDGVTAIRALNRLPDLNWQFDAVGSGPDLELWKGAAAEGGLTGRIRFLPPVNNQMIGSLLERADLLLLPSRFDGWGAVVNEALMCGVPVVCSDNCGAADLLRDSWRGSTFKMGSVEDLQIVLRKWIELGRRTEESSARIRNWSSALEGPQVARYLVDTVEHIRGKGNRPSPPWY